MSARLSSAGCCLSSVETRVQLINSYRQHTYIHRYKDTYRHTHTHAAHTRTHTHTHTNTYIHPSTQYHTLSHALSKPTLSHNIIEREREYDSESILNVNMNVSRTQRTNARQQQFLYQQERKHFIDHLCI